MELLAENSSSGDLLVPSLSDQSAILSVFFGGTSSSFVEKQTYIEFFGTWTDAFILFPKNKKDSLPSGEKKFKMLFDGCGVTNGLMGTIFSVGLDKQVKLVENTIKNVLLKKFDKLTVNAIGLSRGGMACLMLACKLIKADPKRVTLNLILFDPVPGNSLTSASADFSGIFCFANHYKKVEVDCLSRVLALYPHVPLPDNAMHAPLIPEYGKNTNVTEEVILGCHQGAFFWRSNSLSCRLSFIRIYETMLEYGTTFKTHSPNLKNIINKNKIIKDLNSYCSSDRLQTTRIVHSSRKVAITAHKSATHLNQWHYDQDIDRESVEKSFLCEIVDLSEADKIVNRLSFFFISLFFPSSGLSIANE
jgi:hypothetical protein